MDELDGVPANIIVVLSDDQGRWATGSYGNDEIQTPAIDGLARTGVRLDRFFVATPVCSPSRATLLTGLIPSQHGVHEWLYSGQSQPGRPNFNMGPDARPLLQGETAYTDVLAAHGYRCGISGKWHLGDSLNPQHSFEWWFVHRRGGGPYQGAPMVRDGRPTVERGYITDVITDEALGFLGDHVRVHPDRPFYLSVHYTAPHTPWVGHPPDIVALYDDCDFASCPQEPRHPWATAFTDEHMGNRDSLKGYFAAVTAMDRNIARLVAWLDATGLRERTLVVFLSDNGFSCGHHGFWGKGNGTTPRNMYENSITVPAIFNHPGTLPAGLQAGAMVSAYDLMPTLLDYAGLPLPDDRPRPGRSLLPVLQGRAADHDDEVVVYDEYGPVRMIRTPEWKYVHREPDGPNELFDLVADPDERHDLAGDLAHAGLARELHGRMDAWFARYVDPARDGLHVRRDAPPGAW